MSEAFVLRSILWSLLPLTMASEAEDPEHGAALYTSLGEGSKPVSSRSGCDDAFTCGISLASQTRWFRMI